ncbi:MAG: c-type cytochrome domain-containing protein [Bacteroidota bacterium]
MFVILLGSGPVPKGVPPPTFEDIYPIFEDNCIMCHSGPKASRGLQLNSMENVLKGSENGPVLKSGDPRGSELIRRLRGISTPRMPLSGPPWLDESEIRLIEEWITQGAPAGNPVSSSKKPLTPANEEEAPTRPDNVTFKDVAPILKAHCVKCHNHKGLMGPPPEGLVLASYREVMNGTERAYVVPGNANASELVRKIRGQSLPRMPFDGPPYLTIEEISLVERWVSQGAMDGAGAKAEIPLGRKVRLRGRLVGPALLDGLEFEMRDGVETKKGIAIGDYVEVRGRVTIGGGIEAERIRER